MERTLPPDRLPTSIPSASFLRASDRRELEQNKDELYITAVAIDERDTGYGRQAIFWVACPPRWGSAERVLTLALNPYRARQVAEIREALRRVDRIGPFRLCHRLSSSGQRAWAIVAPSEADAQLDLPG